MWGLLRDRSSHHCAFEQDPEAPGGGCRRRLLYGHSLDSSNTLLRNRSQSYQYECAQLGKYSRIQVCACFGCFAMLAQYIKIDAFAYAY